MNPSAAKIKQALAYVHHHERETSRPVATREAIVTVGLTPEESEVLLSAVHVTQSEIDALPRNWKRP